MKEHNTHHNVLPYIGNILMRWRCSKNVAKMYHIKAMKMQSLPYLTPVNPMKVNGTHQNMY